MQHNICNLYSLNNISISESGKYATILVDEASGINLYVINLLEKVIVSKLDVPVLAVQNKFIMDKYIALLYYFKSSYRLKVFDYQKNCEIISKDILSNTAKLLSIMNNQILLSYRNSIKSVVYSLDIDDDLSCDMNLITEIDEQIVSGFRVDEESIVLNCKGKKGIFSITVNTNFNKIEPLLDINDSSNEYVEKVVDDSYIIFNTNITGYNRIGILEDKSKVIMISSVIYDNDQNYIYHDQTNDLLFFHQIVGMCSKLIKYDIRADKNHEITIPNGKIVSNPRVVKDKIILAISSPFSIISYIELDKNGTETKVLYSIEATKKISAKIDSIYLNNRNVELSLINSVQDEAPETIALFLHGGPIGQSFYEFDPFDIVFLDKEISVVKPNYRGSLGYGKNHMNALKGNWASCDLEDIAEICNNVYTNKKVILFGASYGGFLALVASRFVKNCIGIITISPFHSLKLLNELGDYKTKNFLRLYGGYLNENDDKRFYPEKMTNTAPVLLLHGDNDNTINLRHSIRIYEDLKKSHIDVTFKTIEMGHNITKSNHLVEIIRNISLFISTKL